MWKLEIKNVFVIKNIKQKTLTKTNSKIKEKKQQQMIMKKEKKAPHQNRMCCQGKAQLLPRHCKWSQKQLQWLNDCKRQKANTMIAKALTMIAKANTMTANANAMIAKA